MKFTILGERCSGTNFLIESIINNFDLELTWEYGFKHFFGYNKFENSDDTIFIGIIRNPYEWLCSFYKNPHQLPEHLKTSFLHFLSKEFYSVYNDTNIEYDNDHNFINDNKRYTNIFELRNVKCKYLLETIPNLVKNYYLIKYEDLRDNYEYVLKSIAKKFNLIPKNKIYQEITYYKDQYNKLFNKNIYINDLSPQFIRYISNNLNHDLEIKLGYDIIKV